MTESLVVSINEVNKKINNINNKLKNSDVVNNLNQETINKVNKINNVLEEENIQNVNINKKRDIFLPEDKLFEPIGILDPEGLRDNPLTGEPYKNLYKDLPESQKPNTYAGYAEFWSGLPVYKKTPEEEGS